MATIKVTVTPAGETTIEVNGMKGEGCKQVTAALEAKLGNGNVISTEPTREMWEDNGASVLLEQ